MALLNCEDGLTGQDVIDAVNGLSESASAQESASNLAASESLESQSSSLVNYEDVSTYLEEWSDLSGWVETIPSGVQVSGNVLYSLGANSGKNGINYSISLADGENLRVMFKINGKVPTGSSGGVILGINTQAAGAIPNSGGNSVYGLYLRNDSVAQSVTDGVFENLDNDSDSFDKSLDWDVCLQVDEDYISIVAISGDSEIRVRFERSGVDINNIQIFNSDTDLVAGLGIAPVYISKTVKSFGEVESRTSRVWSGDGVNNFKLYLPVGYDSRKPLKLCIGFHGNGSSENHWSTNSNGVRARSAIQDAGYAFLGCTYAANKTTWGAQESLDAYCAAYNWVKSLYPIANTVFYANSMGGIESLLAMAERRIPNVLAWVGTNPTTNLATNYANELFTNSINNAYGITGGNPYDVATSGHDPMLKTSFEFFNMPMLFIAALDDDVVPKAENSDLMIDKLNGVVSTSLIEIPTGGHSANFEPYMPDAVSWFNKYTG